LTILLIKGVTTAYYRPEVAFLQAHSTNAPTRAKAKARANVGGQKWFLRLTVPGIQTAK
jgi:hypothetical protein